MRNRSSGVPPPFKRAPLLTHACEVFFCSACVRRLTTKVGDVSKDIECYFVPLSNDGLKFLT